MFGDDTYEQKLRRESTCGAQEEEKRAWLKMEQQLLTYAGVKQARIVNLAPVHDASPSPTVAIAFADLGQH